MFDTNYWISISAYWLLLLTIDIFFIIYPINWLAYSTLTN